MEKSFYKSYFKLEKENWWFRVRRNLIFRILQKYKIGTDKKILDYGCGSGYLVGCLQRMGYDASGLDTSQEAVEFGRTQGVNNLQIAGYGEMPQNSGFDLILALDVVEHIEDDMGAIRGLKGALKPGGLAIITVPAYQWLWGIQDEVAHHFRRYTMSGLTDTIKGSGGFKIVRKTYFNTFLFLPAAVVRLASKWFNIKNRESDFDINSSFLNPLFYFIFNTEVKSLKWFNFPFGVSILLILKKND